MSISSLSVRRVRVAYNRPWPSNGIPIGSAIIGAPAHRFSSRPGATRGVTEARSVLASAAAESEVSRTMVGVNDAACSIFSGRRETGAETGGGAPAGGGGGGERGAGGGGGGRGGGAPPPPAPAPASSAIERSRAPVRESCPPNV